MIANQIFQSILRPDIYIMGSTVSFLEDAILFLQGLLFCTFPFFHKYTLHECYVFNVIDRLF